jgi:predicted RNA-binding protein with RPS1 domain
MIISFIFLIPISFIVGYYVRQMMFNSEYNEGTGRYGIIECLENNQYFMGEIEELVVAGDMTKVRLIEVQKVSYSTISLKKVSSEFNPWVKTSTIKWFDDNTQKLRKKRLDKLLGK